MNRQDHRAQDSRDKKLIANTPDFKLITTAYHIAAGAYGLSKLSPGHDAALMYIAGRLTQLANGSTHAEFKTDTVRLAYGLRWGGGKTLSAKAWIAAVHRLKKPYSVTVASSEIEALCKIKRDLIDKMDVPADMIGLYHSYGYNEEKRKAGKTGYASEPSTPVEELSDKQFLLVTHNLVRTGTVNLDKYNVYHGRPRDLVVYDESLLVSNAWSIKTKQIKAGRDALRREIEEETDRGDLHVVLRYVEDCLAVMEQEGVTIDRLPDLSAYATDLQPDSVALLLPKDCPKSVHTLLQATGREVRVMRDGNRGAAWFTLKVPDDLKSVMVLDASHVIRELGRLGSNITTDARAVAPDVSYSDMTIEYFKHQAGRGYIEAECKKPVKHRKLAKIIADWIKALPETDTALVWTFKERPGQAVNISKRLKEALEHHGVDMTRVDIQTHGKGRGSNEFGSCTAVAFYGVFEPDKLATGSQIIGQQRALDADLSDLDRVHYGEILHEASQEIARSNIRHIDRGRAGRCRVLFPCWRIEEVSERLGTPTVFMGVKMIRRSDLDSEEALNSVKDTLTKIVGRSILATLTSLDNMAMDGISSRKLRPMVEERVGFKITKQVWKDAANRVATNRGVGLITKSEQGPHLTSTKVEMTPESLTDIGWRRTPQGFVRLTGKDYGFSDTVRRTTDHENTPRRGADGRQ